MPAGRPRIFRDPVRVLVTLEREERDALELQAYIDGWSLTAEARECLLRGLRALLSENGSAERTNAPVPAEAFVKPNHRDREESDGVLEE